MPMLPSRSQVYQRQRASYVADQSTSHPSVQVSRVPVSLVMEIAISLPRTMVQVSDPLLPQDVYPEAQYLDSASPIPLHLPPRSPVSECIPSGFL